MPDKHVAMPLIDDEETLILEEESRSRIKPSDALPIKIEAPKELPKISLVNESLKKLKFHLAKFDSVVKIKTTSNALIEVEWGFEHMKDVFNNDILPFLKSLKDNFNEQADILRGIVKQAKAKQPLDNVLDFACNKKNDRISQIPSRNMKNKVEAQPRNVNKKNRVVEPIHNVDDKQSQLNANSELICATCKKYMFDGVHDLCILDIVKNVNSRAKSAKKHKKQNIWKPTGHVSTEVGFKWKPTSRTFTIVCNLCLLTRIALANVVPHKKTTSHSVEIQKPELKVYSKKPKIVKNIGSSKKAKIVESKNAHHLEPNHTWGSNAIDIPSSSSLVMKGCPDCYLVSGL
nr:hypothetical protein [Tanacetum cinerariifolium]